MTLAQARTLVACCVVCGALVACSASDVSEPVAEPPPSTEPVSAQQSERSDALHELAAAAGEAADLPTLLLIVNKTTDRVLLTSADEKKTATIDPGKSMKLGSKRVCGWLPLTASTSDGRFIEEYTQPCHGQTWTITD